MNAKAKVKRIKEIAKELAAMFPGQRVDLDECASETPHLWVFGHTTYKDAVEACRSLGVKQREKTPGEHNTNLDGEVDGLRVTATTPELPPTCRLEVRKKRIPKTQVVTLADQYVEVEERVVVCDGATKEEDTGEIIESKPTA